MNNKEIRFMVIDDEPIAHRIIEEYCTNLPHFKLVNHSYNALEAMQFLATDSVDLMFLDINMPKLSGFDFLKTLTVKPQVIVTTAYQEFALEGFELNVSDYLLKPFSFERFLKAVNKIHPKNKLPVGEYRTTSNSQDKTNALEQRIFIKGDKARHQIALNDILYIEACGNYCLVYSSDSKIVTHQKISQFEKELPPCLFMRVHKSFIIAKNKVNCVSSSQLEISDETIPIGQTYKKMITEFINKTRE
ncbi:LytTR family DNA-binding domain-containing protein [Colwellia sp. MB02u-14]|uniref:LytR/AlgR family response regulator transcription factor n=1 Tax=Colwellia sp. MB02u-14 TaxID=2759815 RepID=UPI0015F6A268|nr:LytTR family DNA-binding domain-containing protein [Colwellia sp. MB02u-14]MBA6302743.1 response regulator transcription factor [Colwellia sp. MB02u-14]